MSFFTPPIRSQVLVPPVEHVDRPGELCDYGSWRGRGWCRLELSGAALARNTVRIMVVKSAVAQPEFLVPLDALFLSPGTGTYVSLVQRVCACNHVPSTVLGSLLLRCPLSGSHCMSPTM